MKPFRWFFHLLLLVGLLLAPGIPPYPVQAGPATSSLPDGGDQIWKRNLSLGPNEWVYAMAAAPNGDVYIAGDFTEIGGLKTGLVARWGAADHQWHTLGKGITWGRIYSLAISGDYLYVGGYFDAASDRDILTNAIARWNMVTNTWSNVGGPGMSRTSGSPDVFALTVDGSGNVYAGGDFDFVNGIPAGNVAKWNGSSWSAIGALGSSSEQVRALVWHAPYLIAGGNFAGLKNIAAWNGLSWSTLGGGVGGFYNDVIALAADSTYLYVGGEFDSVTNSDSSTIPVSYIARWSWASAAWSDMGGGFDGADVDALTVGPDGKVYAGGRFNKTKTGGINTSNLARWSGSAWEPIHASTSLAEGVHGNVYGLGFSGQDLWIMGGFQSSGSLSANYVVKWNLSDQQWHTPGGNTPNGPIYAVLVDYPNIYYGGAFTSAGGIETNGLARYNVLTNTWSALGSGLSGCGNFLCSGPVVRALALSGSNLYVGGDFTSAGGNPAYALARFDLNTHTWYNVGSGVSCTGLFCTTVVYSLRSTGSDLYVGGLFQKAGAVTVNNVARWNGSAWSAFYDSTSGLTGTNGGVYSIDIDPLTTNVYIGGSFTNPPAYIARWNGSHWYTVGSSALNGAVNALNFLGVTLYIGGNFTAAGSGANYVARYSSGNWVALNGSVNAPVRALANNGSELLVGGDFTTAGAISARHIVRWAGGKWVPMGSGVSGVSGFSESPTVNAIALHNNYVYLGGTLRTAGPWVSDNIAIWGGRPTYVPLAKR